MAFHSLTQLAVVTFLVLSITMVAEGKKKNRKKGFTDLGCSADSEINKNISALWTHVKLLTQPIEVHVHDRDERLCDDYFGCDYHGHGHGHGHDHDSHSHHKDKAKSKGKGKDKGKGAKHSHKHGASHSHKHGASHSHHGGHGDHGAMSGFQDNHIHIHLSVNNKDDCGFVSYAPKDEFVYARCDMVQEKRSGISGSILMRQKPHDVLQTKVQLKGFKGPSEGIKGGKHDYFFDMHDKADFSKGCASFGSHEHVHHNDGKFDHEHKHKHEHDDKGHNHEHKSHAHHSHGSHHSHGDHTVHDHHAHEDDWGNVIINKKGIANMEVNCTHHELYGPESMFGRGLVLHDKDDKTVSCCAITYANLDDDAWDKL